MKRLRFSTRVNAPRMLVWKTMLGLETYGAWTAAFGEGSTYEGSWEKGAGIRFLSPGGDGMTSRIVENVPGRFVSIRHLGLVAHGVDDTESPAARAWASALENYTFTEKGGATEVVVETDTIEELEEDFSRMWPEALRRLKGLCEA